MSVLIEKEYKKLSKNDPTIGLVMMVKNEKKRLHVTLNSVLGYVDALIIYDTGSTDNTIEIVKDFSEKNKINLYLIQGSFKDFSTSRNVVLDYADKIDVNYLLLMDCNDELQGGAKLREYTAQIFNDEHYSGFMVCQHWWSGKHDRYYNMRLVRARTGWRYNGSVHEWMGNKKYGDLEDPNIRPHVVRLPSDIILYQDRTQDDDKTSKRFIRDKFLLLKDYKKDPTDSRTLYYLAQTCDCLKEYDEAFYYSRLRTKYKGFDEEVFHAYMRCGMMGAHMRQEWEDVLPWFMKAYEHSNRVEPLIKLASYYYHEKVWHIAYMYTSTACSLEYPSNLLLFVDTRAYSYERWHLMGIIAYYIAETHFSKKEYDQALEKCREGKRACDIAIKTGENVEMDKKNLGFYLEQEKKILEKISNKNSETKQDFLNRTIKDLQKKFPKMNRKHTVKRAKELWKHKDEKNTEI